VTVEPDEVEPLAAALGMTPAALVRELLRPVGQELRLYEWPNGDCVLFEPETRGCRAYAARPRQCRTWPFWERNLQNRDAWRAVAAECPGCDQGPTFDLGEIQRRARGER
jgi:Fe-S-cluster containining protein